RQAVTVVDGPQDGQSVVLRMIDKSLFGIRGDDDGGNAGAVAPESVVVRRSDMVPTAAVLVVSDDDSRVRPIGAVLNGVDDIGDMLLPVEYVGVARMFIVRANRLDEANGRQVSIGQVIEEIEFVLEMSSGQRVALPIGQPRREIVIVSKWLVVPLKQRVRRVVRRGLAVVGRI